MKTLRKYSTLACIAMLMTLGLTHAQEEDAQTPKPEQTEHRFPETTLEGKRAMREKTFDAIVDRMEANRARLHDIDKSIQELQLKGTPMNDSSMQKLMRERVEIEKDDKALEEDIKAAHP